jgi:hypothetical protein
MNYYERERVQSAPRDQVEHERMRKPRFAPFDDAVRAWFEAGGSTPLAIRASHAELRAFLLWHAGHFGGVSPSAYEGNPGRPSGR